MPYYFYANIRITNPEEYQKYLDKVDPVFSKFNGRYLAVDNSPDLLEGRWDYSKTVLIKFENRHDFENWYFSDDYQEILKYRLSAAICDSILIQGID